MSDRLVGYYSEFWGDCIPLSQVDIIDPELGGVGGQAHRQVRVRHGSLETDMSYEDFAKEWQPVYLKNEETSHE